LVIRVVDGDEALDRLRRTIARRPPFPPAFLEYASQLGKIGRVDDSSSRKALLRVESRRTTRAMVT
jgi:hypothetical protein